MKLIRDKIPRMVYKEEGRVMEVFKVPNKALLSLFKLKLAEETFEVLKTKNREEMIEELADLSEVIDSMLKKFKCTRRFNTVKKNKRSKRGSFTKGIAIKDA